MSKKNSQEDDFGVIYVATGEQFVKEAIISAEQLKCMMPDVNITLFSDLHSDSSVFDSIIDVKNPTYSFLDKVKSLQRSPYEKTLYIDTDIYVNEPVYELFDILDHFDMAAALDAHQQPVIPNDEYAAPEIYGEYHPVPEFNCGLISFRNTANVMDCFERWESKYDTSTDWADQPSLIHAFQHSNVSFCPLPRRYNYIPGLRNNVSGIVKIFHNRLYAGMSLGYKDVPPEQLHQLIERVNYTSEARVTYPYRGEIRDYTDLEVLTEDSLPKQFFKSFLRLGPIDGIKSWTKRLEIKLWGNK